MTITIKGGTGKAITLMAGEAVRLVNTPGTQVVDTWAVMMHDPIEMMSVEHTRRTTGHLHPVVRDVFVSNRRTPMLRLDEDATEATHDTIVACCDRWLYRCLGAPEGHANCHDNFLTALDEIGIAAERVPNPLNLWMNVPVVGNSVDLTGPLSQPGDYVVMRALAPLALVFSACPMDIVPINGPDLSPKDVHATILRE